MLPQEMGELKNNVIHPAQIQACARWLHKVTVHHRPMQPHWASVPGRALRHCLQLGYSVVAERSFFFFLSPTNSKASFGINFLMCVNKVFYMPSIASEGISSLDLPAASHSWDVEGAGSAKYFCIGPCSL